MRGNFWARTSLSGSTFSDFPTLSTLISAGLGACPSAPTWPGVSEMISYRARGFFVSSLRRFLSLFSPSFFYMFSRLKRSSRSYP